MICIKKRNAQKVFLTAVLFILLMAFTSTALAQSQAPLSVALGQMDTLSPITIDNLHFKNLRIDATVKVVYTQSTEEGGTATIKGREGGYIKTLHVDVAEETLTIWSDEKIKGLNSIFNFDDTPVTIYLTAPALEKIVINGAGEFEADGGIRQTELTIDLAGAAEMDAYLEVETLRVIAQGACDFDLKGTAQQATYTLQGASKGDCEELQAKAVTAVLQGASSLEVYATDTLDVEISGVGEVEYKGNPVITKNIQGVGSIVPKN